MKIPSWISDAVFYEIYPQSFYDSNNDGIGDIQGVVEKLDYIKELGCTAIWLNPCFESPFYDAGYDVSDYYTVASRYGTNADLKRLFQKAHKLGIKVCLDLVPGHTSIEHKWFQKSAEVAQNEYTNRYIWTDNVWNVDTANMSAINGYGNRDGRYITNFFWSQPALNYGFAKQDKDKRWQLPTNHPDVLATRQELKNIIRFWLDMGADGYRVDMASSLVKNDAGWQQTSILWQDIRKMMQTDYPEAVLISEWGNPQYAVKAGFHVDFMLHFADPAYTKLFRQEAERDCFGIGTEHGNSIFDTSGKGDITIFTESFTRHYKSLRGKGFIAIPSGNHDISRLSVNRSVEELKVAMAFLITQPGIPFIYYGDEIGMRYLEGLASKEGGYGRTGSRTPMQWSNNKNKGFSAAKPSKLYLPIDNSKEAPTVASQLKNDNSLLNTVKKLIQLRKSSPAFSASGDFEILFAKKNKFPFVYMRKKGRDKFVVAINPTSNEVKADFDVYGVKVCLELKPISYRIYRFVNKKLELVRCQ